VQTLYRILVRLGVVAAIPSLILLAVGGISYFDGRHSSGFDLSTAVSVEDCQAVHVSEPWLCDPVIALSSVRTPAPYEGPLSVSAFLAAIPFALWLLAWVVKPTPVRCERPSQGASVARQPSKQITETDVLGSNWIKQQVQRLGIDP
jgi:hypothetical protein